MRSVGAAAPTARGSPRARMCGKVTGMTKTHTLDVPGARLHYETQGEGPLLLLVGSPMDSSGFAPLAGTMADEYTVVTYDPRGVGRSTREDDDADITPEQQADDVHRIITTLGGGPVDLFGSSGGAVVGLALVAAHPDAVATFVAHEPPVVEMLPDKEKVRGQISEIIDTYHAAGGPAAMQKFMEHAGLGGMGGGEDAPRWQPTPEQLAQMDATNKVFFTHLMRGTTGFRPDLAALRDAPTRIVVGVGETSKGQLAHRTAEAFAERFGTQVVAFPGDHGGFMMAEPFGQALKQVLTESA
jgi:pimeloyl-ACP methyl ester carboxylesterase